MKNRGIVVWTIHARKHVTVQRFNPLPTAPQNANQKKTETFWIILGVLSAAVFGVLIWIIVVRVKHSHHYKVGNVMNDIRKTNGTFTVSPTISHGHRGTYGSEVP